MIKKILIALGVIIGLLAIALVVFLLTFDLNHYRQFAMDQATKMLGRPVQIQSLSTKLSLVPTIKVEGVRILDPDQNEPLLEIPKLEAVIDLPPLVHRQVFIQKIVVPDGSLVWRGKANEGKTKTEAVSVPQQASKSKQQIWIENVNINALHCSLGKEKPYDFQINKLNLKNMSKFSFEVVYLKNTVNVSGNFGSILEIFKKDSLPVELSLSQGKASLKINGAIDDFKNLKNMRFQIDGDVSDLSNFLQNWGIQHKKIPSSNLVFKTSMTGDLEVAKLGETTLTMGKSELSLTTSKGTLLQLAKAPIINFDAVLSLKKGDIATLWGINPLEMTAKVTATPQTFTLGDITFNAGKSDLKGKLRLGSKDQIVSVYGSLESVYFDIHDLCAQQKTIAEQKVTSAPAQKIFSDEKLPFDILKNLDADIQLDIAHLKFTEKASDYAAIKGNIGVKKNILQSNMKIKMFDGNINNQLTIDANKRHVATSIQARNVRLEKVKALEKSIRGSMANADISISAVGESVQQLAGSVNGQIVAELSAGEIINKEFNSLPATLNILKGKNTSLSFSTQDQKTQLLCGAMNVPVQNGIIVSNNHIALETDTLNFVIDGRVNLKNETIDLSMIPSVSQTRGMANEVLALGQSVQLTGPFSNIKIGVNPLKATNALVQMVGQTLSGNKEQSAPVEATSLCQKVLGRPLAQNKKGNAGQAIPQKAKTNTVNNQQPQQNLKQKLVQSLSQALSSSAPESK